MKIQYLGTAAAEGWPAIFCNCQVCRQAAKRKGKNIRTRSQTLIDEEILIDFPPDAYMHMLQYEIKFPDIQTLLVTHSHQDHWYPEELMFRGKGFAENINGTLHIYGNEAVYDRLKEAEVFGGESMARNAKLEFHIIREFQVYTVGAYQFIPLRALHNRKENCYIYIIQKGENTILYGNDTGYFPEETWEFIKDYHFDLVSLDCTMQRQKEGTNHMGLLDNREVADRLKEMRCAGDNTKFVLNHFSHNGGMLHEEIEREASKYGFLTAYDGMTIEVK